MCVCVCMYVCIYSMCWCFSQGQHQNPTLQPTVEHTYRPMSYNTYIFRIKFKAIVMQQYFIDTNMTADQQSQCIKKPVSTIIFLLGHPTLYNAQTIWHNMKNSRTALHPQRKCQNHFKIKINFYNTHKHAPKMVWNLLHNESERWKDITPTACANQVQRK